MSDLVKDIHDFYTKIGLNLAVDKLSKEQLDQYLRFRVGLIREELGELSQAVLTEDPEEVVDALVDLVVVALGTLENFRVDTRGAWNEVMRANESKVVGVKKGRPNPLNLPDLMKPDGWKGPEHAGNHGILQDLW